MFKSAIAMTIIFIADTFKYERHVTRQKFQEKYTLEMCFCRGEKYPILIHETRLFSFSLWFLCCDYTVGTYRALYVLYLETYYILLSYLLIKKHYFKTSCFFLCFVILKLFDQCYNVKQNLAKKPYTFQFFHHILNVVNKVRILFFYKCVLESAFSFGKCEIFIE